MPDPEDPFRESVRFNRSCFLCRRSGIGPGVREEAGFFEFQPARDFNIH